ncbi:MAG: hypothetical protein JW915_18340 [Chitinispirillaceae bacterium]|nr:hypothetical protein [Chitinispirillaceae bacterium]
MNLFHVGLVIVTIFSAVSAQVKISGKIQDTLLSAERNPFIINDNVVVPAGQKLVITKGCVLLFKPFTSISVEGSLIVQGDSENQVIFTSEYDTRFNRASSQFPNPFDWNGILIGQNAGEVHMSYFSVAYSVYGVKSYKSDIIIENGVFSSNGQSNISINEVMINVADGIAYSYRQNAPLTHNVKSIEEKTYGRSVTVPGDSSVTITEDKKPIDWYKVAQIGCIGGGSLSLAATLYFFINAVNNQNIYLHTADVAQQVTYKKRRNSSCTFSIVSAVPTVLFTGGAAALFILEKRESENKKISMSPSFGDCNGFVLALEF